MIFLVTELINSKGDALKIKHFLTLIIPRGFKATEFMQLNVDSKDWSVHEGGKCPLSEDSCLVPIIKNLPTNYRKVILYNLNINYILYFLIGSLFKIKKGEGVTLNL